MGHQQADSPRGGSVLSLPPRGFVFAEQNGWGFEALSSQELKIPFLLSLAPGAMRVQAQESRGPLSRFCESLEVSGQ